MPDPQPQAQPQARTDQTANLTEIERMLAGEDAQVDIDEISRYVDTVKLEIQGDPLAWWRDRADSFPNLGKFCLFTIICD